MELRQHQAKPAQKCGCRSARSTATRGSRRARTQRAYGNRRLGQCLGAAQGMCAECAEEEERGGGGADKASLDDPRALQRQLGEGVSLSSSVRQNMEEAFGVNFSHVRLHTDAKAAALAARHDAKAFTVGRHIAFAAGQYKPGTPAGDALIAHELAHVVQQRGAETVQTSGGAEERALDADADQSATGAMLGIWARAKSKAVKVVGAAMPALRSGLRLQRCKGNKTPDGVGLGPTDLNRTFCPKPGAFTVTHGTGSNTSASATGRQDIRFEGVNSGAQDGKTCACDCGLYRQFIRGYWKTGTSAKQYVIASCAPNTITLSETDWTEEHISCIGDNDADACKFSYTDYPGLNGLSEGLATDLHFDFIYQIWDKCQGRGVESQSKTLTISGSTSPRSITWS